MTKNLEIGDCMWTKTLTSSLASVKSQMTLLKEMAAKILNVIFAFYIINIRYFQGVILQNRSFVFNIKTLQVNQALTSNWPQKQEFQSTIFTTIQIILGKYFLHPAPSIYCYTTPYPLPFSLSFSKKLIPDVLFLSDNALLMDFLGERESKRNNIMIKKHSILN